jgi:hypothetical protein
MSARITIRINCRILMKLGMNIVTLETTPLYGFQFPVFDTTNLAIVRT